MNQQTSKFNVEEDDKNKGVCTKTLPNAFEDDSKDFWKYLAISTVLHPLAAFIIWGSFWILVLLGIHNPLANRPEWKTKDIEFVLTMNEADPIDKNTKYRSDRNSRAGGKHDPTRKVSMPSPAPSPAPAPAQKPAAAPKQAAPKVQKQTPKPAAPVQKQPVKQQAAPKPQAQPKKSGSTCAKSSEQTVRTECTRTKAGVKTCGNNPETTNAKACESAFKPV